MKIRLASVGSTAVILLTCSKTKAPCPIRVKINSNDQTGGAGGDGRASNLSAAWGLPAFKYLQLAEQLIALPKKFIAFTKGNIALSQIFVALSQRNIALA